MTRTFGIRKLFVIGLAATCVLSLSACANQGPARPSGADRINESSNNFQHVVQSGETLGMIADWYTGRSSNWTQIVDVNPGLRPERLRPGQIVLIPRRILVKDTPIPKNYAGKKRVTGPAGNATGVESAGESEINKDSGAVKSVESSESSETTKVEETTTGTDIIGKEIGSTSTGAESSGAEAAKIEDDAKKIEEGANSAAKAAEEAANAAHAEAERAAEKARADAAAAAKAAADAAEAAKNGQKAGPDDAEREKLLDELLAQ